MFKRLTWMGAGLVTGFVASKWVERKARRRLARYFPSRHLPSRYLPSGQPLNAGAELADKARELAVAKIADLRTAVDEGRSTMVARKPSCAGSGSWPSPGSSGMEAKQMEPGPNNAVAGKRVVVTGGTNGIGLAAAEALAARGANLALVARDKDRGEAAAARARAASSGGWSTWWWPTSARRPTSAGWRRRSAHATTA